MGRHSRNFTVFWEYLAFGMWFDSNLNVSYFLQGRTNQAALLGSPSSHHSQSLTVGPREVKRLCALLTFPTWWRLWQTVLQQALPAPPTVLICQIHLRRRSICPWTRAPALPRMSRMSRSDWSRQSLFRYIGHKPWLGWEVQLQPLSFAFYRITLWELSNRNLSVGDDYKDQGRCWRELFTTARVLCKVFKRTSDMLCLIFQYAQFERMHSTHSGTLPCRTKRINCANSDVLDWDLWFFFGGLDLASCYFPR